MPHCSNKMLHVTQELVLTCQIMTPDCVDPNQEQRTKVVSLHASYPAPAVCPLLMALNLSGHYATHELSTDLTSTAMPKSSQIIYLEGGGGGGGVQCLILSYGPLDRLVFRLRKVSAVTWAVSVLLMRVSCCWFHGNIITGKSC